MKFTSMLKERYQKYKTVLCLGLDPVLEKIPVKDQSNLEETLYTFYSTMMEAHQDKIMAVKPNIAFYEQYGIEGLQALKRIINSARSLTIPVILDAKRGDIGNTARAYAKAAFEDLEADAITLSPYLGGDSMEPFFQYNEKGFFILARTSNPGSLDFQKLTLANGSYLFMNVAEKIAEWNRQFVDGIGAVVGATHPEELQSISSMFAERAFVPLLIPGVGKQGGDFKQVMGILDGVQYPRHLVLINSSSKINYAWQQHPDVDWVTASGIEIDAMQLQ
jgi:orotidine-5'-phosphate decarboxylase